MRDCENACPAVVHGLSSNSRKFKSFHCGYQVQAFRLEVFYSKVLPHRLELVVSRNYYPFDLFHNSSTLIKGSAS